MTFTEDKLEQAYIELLTDLGYEHRLGVKNKINEVRFNGLTRRNKFRGK